MNPIFEMPDGWEQPSPRIIALAKRVIEEIVSGFSREIDAENRLTEHFWHRSIHFKMYLN